jgi:hypothetical protein
MSSLVVSGQSNDNETSVSTVAAPSSLPVQPSDNLSEQQQQQQQNQTTAAPSPPRQSAASKQSNNSLTEPQQGQQIPFEQLGQALSNMFSRGY